MLVNGILFTNSPVRIEQATDCKNQYYSIEVPAGFAVEVVDNDGAIAIRLEPKADKNVSDNSIYEIERMIEFGAHSREFIDYAFGCHEEWVIRNNLPKLLKNGLSCYSFLNLEKEAAKGKTPVEVESILDWYVERLEYLKKDDDIYIASLIRLLIEIGLDAGLEGNWALRLYMSANEKELLDPYSCAEGYFLYRHRDDEDAHYSLTEKESWCMEEVDSIFDAYFSFPVDDEDEEEY